MKTMAEALKKLAGDSEFGPMFQEARRKAEQEVAEVAAATKARAEQRKAQAREEYLDDLLRAHERTMERACREGLPGLAPTSALDLLPGSRALHNDRPCTIKAHLLDMENEEVLVIVRYERKYDCPYVQGRQSEWNMVKKTELRPWQPKRPG